MCYPALVDIATDFNTSYHTAQQMVSVWLAGICAASCIAGRFAPRPLLLCAASLYLFATFVCFLTPSISILLAARLLQGIALGAFLTHHEIKSWIVISWMVAPFLGGALLTLLDWRTLYALLFFGGLGGLIALFLLLPDEKLPRDTARRETHFLVSALVPATLFSALYIWMSASPYLIIEKLGFSSFVLGAVQVPIFGGAVVGALLSFFFYRWGVLIALLSAMSLVLSNLFFAENLFTLIAPMSGIAFGFGALSPHLKRDKTTVAIYFFTATVATFWVSIMEEYVVSVCALILIFASFSALSRFAYEKLRTSPS